jgi:hypothetical protein
MATARSGGVKRRCGSNSFQKDCPSCLRDRTYVS